MAKTAKSKSRKNNGPKEARRKAASKQDTENATPFEDDGVLDDDKVFIECPGATAYDPVTREITAGVEFVDENDPSAGYRIVNHPVYAPEHKKRRLIKKEHRNSIRRCQACQDLTVRLIRREGPDFYIPNSRFPRKKQLRSVEKNW
jgi:hypothetical protein